MIEFVILAGCSSLLGYMLCDLKHHIDLVEVNREDDKVHDDKEGK